MMMIEWRCDKCNTSLKALKDVYVMRIYKYTSDFTLLSIHLCEECAEQIKNIINTNDKK